MLFFAPKAIVYLKPNLLEILTSDKSYKLNIPPSIIENEEVKDINVLTNMVSAFLKVNKLPKSKANIILSGDLVFQRALSKEEFFNMEKVKQDFLNDLPYPSDISLVKSNKTILFSANKAFFDVFISIFNHLGWKTELVLPEVLFSMVNYSEVQNNKDNFKNISLC